MYPEGDGMILLAYSIAADIDMAVVTRQVVSVISHIVFSIYQICHVIVVWNM